MLIYCCLDPQDPYAEREVQVTFEWTVGGPRLIAAVDQHDDDILPDLVEVQRDDLRREIVDAHRLPTARLREALSVTPAGR
ncbi:hypothetical protein [Methylobacterium sp. NEAU K]|uniref:hypothetical protein n=1 Tax=Methylobacterium sp. NEAU K TaxID=3064946 RepID=UPI002736ABDE|nr:hypothetical protein [Methylobacterium sp. NEAU K]MDP4003582.1 hypothetical protein [Methylobacterium sp. NEAU K]